MDRRQKAMRIIGVAVVAVAVALSLFLALSYVFPWSGLNSTHIDVDVNSGNLRTTRPILFLPVQQRSQATWISEALARPMGSPDWRRTHTFGPGRRISPHHADHGSPYQLGEVEWALKGLSIGGRERQGVAERLLRSWRHGSHHDASLIVDDLVHRSLAEGGSVI